MKIMASFLLRQRLIDIINKNNNVDYTVNDINTIRFTLYMISIWMTNDNRFDIKYDIINSIENK